LRAERRPDLVPGHPDLEEELPPPGHLAELVAKWAVAWQRVASRNVLPALAAVIAVASDAADRRVRFSVMTTGILDGSAHLTFAALGLWVLCLLVDLPRRFCIAALVASVAIDLDLSRRDIH
jgi:hypothetical protein